MKVGIKSGYDFKFDEDESRILTAAATILDNLTEEMFSRKCETVEGDTHFYRRSEVLSIVDNINRLLESNKLCN